MSDLTRRLRKIIAGHDVIIPERIFLQILDELEAQEGELANLRAAISQQAQKLAGHAAQAKRRLDKLEGVHGA